MYIYIYGIISQFVWLMFYPPFCLCNILSGDVRRAEPCLTAWTWQGGCCGASAVQWGYPYSTYSWMVHVMENPVIFGWFWERRNPKRWTYKESSSRNFNPSEKGLKSIRVSHPKPVFETSCPCPGLFCSLRLDEQDWHIGVSEHWVNTSKMVQNISNQ